MHDLEKKMDGGERYVACGEMLLGKGLGFISCRSQEDVAMHVELKGASALSSFDTHSSPLGTMRVEIRGDGRGPDAYSLA